MKPVFLTPYTFEWTESFNHSTVGESMTIPDDAYSIEELFDRLDRGLSLGSPAPSMYDEEFESIDDYTSSDVPEPDEFYDPSMRKIDRLTYVAEVLDNDEFKKKSYGKSSKNSEKRSDEKSGPSDISSDPEKDESFS